MKEVISYGRFRCKELSPHKNRGMEITYIEKGIMEWMVEGVPEKVEAGSVFFTLPWQAHGSLNPTEPDNTVWHVLFHLKEDYAAPFNHFLFPECFGFTPSEMKQLSHAFSASNRHCFHATPAIRWLMPELITELQRSHELAQAHQITLLRAVLVELKRIISGDTLSADTSTRAEKKVKELLAELSSNCDQPWTLKQMGERCGIHRTRLNTAFQKLTGHTPIEYLARLRIERAKKNLRETDANITQIAFECGFSSSQYFSSTFKNITGWSPSQYRKHYAGLSPAELKKWNEINFRSEQEERQRVKKFSTN